MKFQSSAELFVSASIEPDAYAAASVNGSSVDTQGFHELLAVLSVGDMGTSATLDVHLEDSADDTTFADIPNAVFSQKVDATDDNLLFVGRVNLNATGVNRYVRAVAVTAVAAVDHAVFFILSSYNTPPVSQEQSVGFNLTGPT